MLHAKIIQSNKLLLISLGMLTAKLHIDIFLTDKDSHVVSKTVDLLDNKNNDNTFTLKKLYAQKTSISFKELSKVYAQVDTELIKYTYKVYVEFIPKNIKIIKELLYPVFKNIHESYSNNIYVDRVSRTVFIKPKKYF